MFMYQKRIRLCLFCEGSAKTKCFSVVISHERERDKYKIKQQGGVETASIIHNEYIEDVVTFILHHRELLSYSSLLLFEDTLLTAGLLLSLCWWSAGFASVFSLLQLLSG